MISMTDRPLILIGLGGIATGYLPAVMYYHSVGLLPFETICFVDGKPFRADNAARQHFQREANKAVELKQLWGRHYPRVPLRIRPEFVTPQNVANMIPNRSVVLLSPDNHATRQLTSNHVESLSDCLLIAGGNSAIDKTKGQDGTEGSVFVHFRVNGRNLTPPITTHHPEIAHPTDDLPTDVGCSELALSQPQLASTNFMVGQTMAELLYCYCCLPDNSATQVVERWMNSSTREQTDYGPIERPVV